MNSPIHALLPNEQSAIALDAIDRLNRAKLRVTNARILILSLLLQDPARGHTLESLARQVIEQGVTIQLCTVSQTIRGLAAHGLLTREWIDGGKSIFWIGEKRQPAHSHQIVCRHCKRSFFVDATQLHSQLTHLGDACGMALAAQPISVHVTCADCEAEQQTLSLTETTSTPKRRVRHLPLRPARGHLRLI